MTAWWIKPLLVALFFAAAVGGTHWYVSNERNEAAAAAAVAVQAEYDREHARAMDALRRDETLVRTAVEKAREKAVIRADRQAAAAAAAHDELGRLRAQLADLDRASPGADAAPGSCAYEAATVRGLFRACTGALEGVGRDAGQLAAQVIGLQDYVRASRAAEIESVSPPAGEGSRAGRLDLVTQPATTPQRPIQGGAASPILSEVVP
jgi:hypothetical protein